MSARRELAGVPASPGLAAGPAWHWNRNDAPADSAPLSASERGGAVAAARAALEAAAAEVAALAKGLAEAEAEILETGVLMASDPTLLAAVERSVREEGSGAAAAILAATENLALQLDSLDDEYLAARAADVRSLGHRAARLAARGQGVAEARPSQGIVLALDLGPADVAEFGAGVAGVALAGGGTTGHAAIVARSLGIPMVVGAGERLLDIDEGREVVVDGDAGTVLGDPRAQDLEAAYAAAAVRQQARRAAASSSGLPAVTQDGVRVGVLANASGVLEVEVALAAGAEGVGLVRTELSFLEHAAWPTAAEHRRFLEPILTQLSGRHATVRLLDFGGDKTPPFLRGLHGRGIELLLRNPDALREQLDAVLAAGHATELRLLVPMVVQVGQLRAVRAALVESAARVGTRLPLVGAMIEVPGAAALIDQIVREVDFVSIGTNDLTALQLGMDRSEPGARPAHHPAVLRLIDSVCTTGRAAGVSVAVCGEAASDPVAMPLLLGLGVDELSVGSSMVGRVRSWVRSLGHGNAAEVARAALDAGDADEVEQLARPLRSLLLAS